MSIKYYKLFDLLNRRNMKKSDLLEIISSKTIAKLSKGENLNTDIIDKLCLFLHCQPNDIMEVFEIQERKKEDGTIEKIKLKTTDIDKSDLEFIVEEILRDKDESYKKIREEMEQNEKNN